MVEINLSMIIFAFLLIVIGIIFFLTGLLQKSIGAAKTWIGLSAVIMLLAGTLSGRTDVEQKMIGKLEPAPLERIKIGEYAFVRPGPKNSALIQSARINESRYVTGLPELKELKPGNRFIVAKNKDDKKIVAIIPVPPSTAKQ